MATFSYFTLFVVGEILRLFSLVPAFFHIFPNARSFPPPGNSPQMGIVCLVPRDPLRLSCTSAQGVGKQAKDAFSSLLPQTPLYMT